MDYHVTYLNCDVLLLADVFENFRSSCTINYNLDPSNYISAASLAWDAMLLNTKIELAQISDLKVLDITERQQRGGLCFVGSTRYVKANKKYCPYYDESKDSNFLLYLDANNFYGWAMSEHLPYDEVRLNTEVDLEQVVNTSDDNDTGYIVECDLSFPPEIHEKLKGYPPCPVNLAPQDEWLSNFQLKTKEDNNMKRKKN